MADDDGLKIHTLSDGGISATHPDVRMNEVLVASSTDKNQHNTLRASLIPIACWRVEDLRFDFDSSFVMPELKQEMRELATLIAMHTKEQAKPVLSVFGHADPSGNDDYNKTLSGRRAMAIYGLLTRDTQLWEELYSQPFGGDNWGKRALQIMSGAATDQSGAPNESPGDKPPNAGQYQYDKAKRRALFLSYMDFLCADERNAIFKLEKTDFLARGRDPQGKGDYQGCGEFNPIMLFSQEEEKEYSKAENKPARNQENAPNRRVLVLLYRPGAQVAPDKWPCPRAKEGVAACKKRFWSDGEDRRNKRLPGQRRVFEVSQDTFACRFYHRNTILSPCERIIGSQFPYEVPWGDAAEGSWQEEYMWWTEANDSEMPDAHTFESLMPRSPQYDAAPPAPSSPHEDQSPIFSQQEEEFRSRLINGEFAEDGNYEADASKDVFRFTAAAADKTDVSSNLNLMVERYAAFWKDRNGAHPDPHTISGGAAFSLPQPNGSETSGGGGHTPGTEIEEVPAWVKLFSNRLIALPRSEYNNSMQYAQASQRLVEAFFNAYAKRKLSKGKIPPGLKEFFAHAGKSQTNEMAVVLGGNAGDHMWCAPASVQALIRGMYKQKYRFRKSGNIQADALNAYNKEMRRQSGLFNLWVAKNVIFENNKNPIDLEPGDIVSWVGSGASPLSGHTATVLHCEKKAGSAPGEVIGVILYASGNAKGMCKDHGSIRVESAIREKPSERFSYNLMSKYSKEYSEIKRDVEKNHAEIDKLDKIKDQERIMQLSAEGTALMAKLVAKCTEAHNNGQPYDRYDPYLQKGVHVPATAGRIWVAYVWKASRLNPYEQGRPLDPALEISQKTLKEQCPDAPD